MPKDWHVVLCPRREGELTVFLGWLAQTNKMR